MDNATDSPSRVAEYEGIGELWIKGQVLEWWSDGSCIRRYNFSSAVLFAGFKEWQDLGLTLCIVLRDEVHFYYLNDNDSFVVSLPFFTSNACFFKNGLILQRVLGSECVDFPGNSEGFYNFICITHPMSPFGSVQFSNSGNAAEMNDLDLVFFPEQEAYGVAVFYQKSSGHLTFYSLQLLQGENGNTVSKPPVVPLASSNSVRKKSYGTLALNTSGSNDSLPAAIQRRKTSDIPYGFSNNLNNNLRKASAYSRRAVSNNWSTEDTNFDAASAVDLAAKAVQTPNRLNSFSLAKRNMSTNVERIIEMTPTINPSDAGSSNDFVKDVYLTKITGVKALPFSVDKTVVSTTHDSKQAIAILDRSNGWGKIWIFNLNYSSAIDIKFKAFGYSPVSMTKTMDIKRGMIEDIAVYRSSDLSGYFAFLQHNSIILFNPYYELTSSAFQINDNCFSRLPYISETRMVLAGKNDWKLVEAPSTFPSGHSLRSIFAGIRYVLASNFHTFLTLWQCQRYAITKSAIAESTEDTVFSKDFSALEKTLLLGYDKEADTFKHPLFTKDASWLANITMALHLMREEFQLNVYESLLTDKLGQLLTRLTSLMDWPTGWVNYYHCPDYKEKPLAYVFDQPIDEPPSIFKTLYSARQQSQLPLTPYITLSRLVDNNLCDIDESVTPLTNRILKLFQALTDNPAVNLLEVLGALGITKKQLEALPLGMYIPLKRLLLHVENNIDHVDDKVNLNLTDRSDLKRIKCFSASSIPSKHSRLRSLSNAKKTTESRSILQLYNDIAEESLDVMTDSPKHGNVKDALRSSKKAIFAHKELFADFVKTLSYSKSHSVELPSLKMDYSSLLTLKKRTATAMAYRALTTGFGYAAAFMCSDTTLNQHNFIGDTLSLDFHFESDDTVISLEKSAFPDDILDWGSFHRGVAKGLALDTNKKQLTSNWLNFNNQDVLDPEYGGFLFAVGLNGHLSVLGEWQLYNFLSPKNTYVSIGLLLGMCVSMRGSMSLKITKVLSVHVLALLPAGSSNLNIDYKIQSAGLVGLGILYENTHNRRISELFCTELTSSIVVNDESVPDEGYRLACGIGLGLINMGCGEKSVNSKVWRSSDDFNIDDYNTDLSGSEHKEPIESSSDSFDMSFKSGTMDQKIIDKLVGIVTSVNDVGEDWMPVNSQLGAIVALMLIFLKTNSQSIANLISVANYNQEVDAALHVRPDLFIFREWCTNMIMWDAVPMDWRWILEILPEQFSSEEVSSDILPLYYRIAGRCLSIGIKGASSNSVSLREGLCKILDMFLPMYQYSLKKNVDTQLLFKGITTLINCIIVALTLVMAGSGDMEVYKRIRYLHSISHGRNSYIYSMFRTDPSSVAEEVEEEVVNSNTAERPKNLDYDNHYGKFMMTNMALGFLFLGMGHYALRTTNIKDLSYLIISVIPSFSPPYYLQETKYLWRLAISERFLLARDASSEDVINDVPLLITSIDSKGDISTQEMKSPCLLPVIEGIRSIKVQSPVYYPLTLEFGKGKLDIDRFFEKGCCIYIKKRSIDDYGKLGENLANNELKVMYYKTLLSQLTASFSIRAKKYDKKNSFYHDFCNKNIEEVELAHYQNPKDDFNLNLLTGIDLFDFELEIWRKRHDL